MTDDSNLTPGGGSDDALSVTAQIRSDKEGHWVTWTKGESEGSLGPYSELGMAENVRAAKERELLENPGTIEDSISD